MLDVGPADARGRLRPERPRLPLFAPARRHPEELLLHDVGDRADPALEERGLLEQRRLDHAVAVAGGQLQGGALEARERGPLVGQQVAGAPRGAKGCRHGAKSSGPRTLRRSADLDAGALTRCAAVIQGPGPTP